MKYYTPEEGKQLEGCRVICDERTCDGKPCFHLHDKPHDYNDFECYCECQHIGHHGFCRPLEELQLDNIEYQEASR